MPMSFPETDALIAAADEGVSLAATEPLLSIERARGTIRRWVMKSK
jgi:hypothetical protein